MTRKYTIQEAIAIAIEGRKWLLLKWQGEYGHKLGEAVQNMRIKQIQEDIDGLKLLQQDF